MSSRLPHRQVATFVLAPGTPEETTVHGQLVTDPNFTSANRIEIFGTKDDEINCMRLFSKHVISWNMYENEEWLKHTSRNIKSNRYGTCYGKTVGRAAGDSISENSIQIVAEFIIIEFTESSSFERDGHDFYRFSFLPHPEFWRPYSGLASFKNPLEKRGYWKNIIGTNMRFRRWLDGTIKRDERIFEQDFILWTPSIEIERVELIDCKSEVKFSDLVEFINIALMFIYCNHHYEVSREELGPTGSTNTHFPVNILQNINKTEYRERLNLGRPEHLIARAAEYLLSHSDHKSELYASVFKYVSSHNGPAIERQLVDCVEALEALVNIYEKNMGWSRDAVDRRTWKVAGKAFRSAIEQCQSISDDLKQVACSALTYPPKVDLCRRIERVICSQRRRWNSSSLPVKNKIEHIVKRRNKIVHGENAPDAQETLYCLLQSQFVFENLFCNLIQHPYRPAAGWWIVSDWRPD
ncbi:MAG: hypothetical protein JJU26_10200 [Oceanicaulis sp.]|uniref:hypothetical protein n=1 Tax=Glycocaulis sp. TaxID=1969725 RepID=UPI0025BD83BD|nr:hypothetical protein [Glycocaulis sp.]MCC5982076.1 hypothetical protein [Oceanicaulis sp.]MCH8521818.1 hypothetical protein [Glycocaulis sp.]